MQPYVVVAHSKAQPGRGDALYELLTDVVRASFEAEPQLLTYAVSRVEGTNDEFLHISVYETPEGFQTHRDSDHVARFFEQAADLLDGEIEIRRSRLAPVSEDPRATLVRSK